jgi:hypothetical protein
MPTHFYAIVWIDHSRAKVFHVGLSGENEIVLHPHLPTRHLHHKANSIGSGHVGLDKEFFAQVMNAVSDAGEILIIGPASAKTELARYLRDKHPQIADRVVAVEAVDHPSDPEIVAYRARRYRGANQSIGLTAGVAAPLYGSAMTVKFARRRHRSHLLGLGQRHHHQTTD